MILENRLSIPCRDRLTFAIHQKGTEWDGNGAFRLLEEVGVLISTMNDIPGYEVTEVLGEVFGVTVRARNIGSQFGAAFKAVAGGELKGMTKNVANSRDEVIQRMSEAAESKGGDAVLAMRFDASELGTGWTEICAYGTAVKIRKL